MIYDTTEAAFPSQVVERSRERPVVVDFWAAWCGPCRALTPALERAARAREGQVDLAKVDVDRNESLAMSFGVRGIPSVKAFRDGRVVDEFTGAIPAEQVERFFDRLVPSRDELEAREAVRSGDEQGLRRVLEREPSDVAAATALARLLIARGEEEEALRVLEPVEQDFLARALRARALLAPAEEELAESFAAWDAGDHRAALEGLQEALQEADDPHTRDLIREVMVGLFTELGVDHPLAREHRRRLSAALY